jgi:hypothetical protein
MLGTTTIVINLKLLPLICVAVFLCILLGFIVGYKVCGKINFDKLHNVMIESQKRLKQINKGVKKYKSQKGKR